VPADRLRVITNNLSNRKRSTGLPRLTVGFRPSNTRKRIRNALISNEERPGAPVRRNCTRKRIGSTPSQCLNSPPSRIIRNKSAPRVGGTRVIGVSYFVNEMDMRPYDSETLLRRTGAICYCRVAISITNIRFEVWNRIRFSMESLINHFGNRGAFNECLIIHSGFFVLNDTWWIFV
jgi:hypothetical protein